MFQMKTLGSTMYREKSARRDTPHAIINKSAIFLF